MAATFTIAKGTTIVVENIFENRYKYVQELNKMGAKITVEGKSAIIRGVRKIYGATPGNYDPKTATPNKPYESDDDMTRVNITPPTGLTDNRTFIISLAAIVLVVVVGEIYFIKKKVLK